MSQYKFQYLLRLGDNTLVLAQQVAAWAGHAPVLEEDIAVANTSLDLIGQTMMWLDYAGEVEGRGRDRDQLAYLRDARDFRNALLVEQANGDFGRTLMRQFLFDAWHVPMLELLSNSDDPRIAEIAAKSIKEASYHLTRSSDLVIRLGGGTEESFERMQNALNDLWPFAGELVAADEIDDAAHEEGYGADLAIVEELSSSTYHQVLQLAGLSFDPEAKTRSGGKTGMHSESLGYILAEMQSLHRAHPGVTW